MSTSIPKIMNFYWDKSSLSYLQYMTIISFNKFNPDWKIVIYEPKVRYNFITWKTDEQRIRYSGHDWYGELKKLNFVEFKEIDFEEIGFKNDVPEVFKSDYLRWYLLSTVGGGWSDMDILYIKPISSLKIDNSDTVICFRGDVHIIGFFLSKPNNDYFRKIMDAVNDNIDLDNYQSLGSTLFNIVHPSANNNGLDVTICNISMKALYPYLDSEIPKMFKDIDLTNITEETIGIHWYNGSMISKLFNNSYDPNNDNTKNTITEILKTIK